jgi:hypothetical protein
MKSQLQRFGLVAVLVVATAMLFACSDGGPTSPPHSQTPQLKDLTQKEHVLDNIELAYNQRQVQWYNGLLDQNFTFFLSTHDVGGGAPASWGRETEISVHTNLFDKNFVGPAPPCQSIKMDLNLDALQWTEVSPESAPAETWYTTTVYYHFTFQIAPNTFVSDNGTRATFTVRDAGPSGNYAHHWQLVEMRDLGPETAVVARLAATATEPSDIGRVKGMYR